MDKRKTNREIIVAVVLLALFAFSIFQAIEITNLESKVTGAATKVGGNDARQQVPKSTGMVPSNLQDLPDMVGGC